MTTDFATLFLFYAPLLRLSFLAKSRLTVALAYQDAERVIAGTVALLSSNVDWQGDQNG